MRSTMKSGAELLLEITDIAHGGDGIARHDGRVVFVPFVIPGEKIRARVTRVRRDWARADALQILSPSPARTTAPCPYFTRCGGCAYQHITGERQLEIKTRQVSEALRRIGKIPSPPVEPARPSPLEYRYRNRITVRVQPPAIGFHGTDPRRIVDVANCMLANDAVNDALSRLRSKKHLRPGVATLRDGVAHDGFRQVNDGAAEILSDLVVEMAGRGGTLLDAYCGAGFFTRRLANAFEHVIGLDWNERAITAARANAGSKEEYRAGDVAALLPAALAEALPDVVLLDPPSQGITPSVIETLLQARPSRLVYVSCDPATLARDIAALSEVWRLTRAVPVDMFPQTAAVETACLLEKI